MKEQDRQKNPIIRTNKKLQVFLFLFSLLIGYFATDSWSYLKMLYSRGPQYLLLFLAIICLPLLFLELWGKVTGKVKFPRENIVDYIFWGGALMGLALHFIASLLSVYLNEA